MNYRPSNNNNIVFMTVMTKLSLTVMKYAEMLPETYDL